MNKIILTENKEAILIENLNHFNWKGNESQIDVLANNEQFSYLIGTFDVKNSPEETFKKIMECIIQCPGPIVSKECLEKHLNK